MVVRKPLGFEGEGVLEISLPLWNRFLALRRGAGGGGGYSFEGDAAREDASDEATMAFAKDSTAAADALLEETFCDACLFFWFWSLTRKDGVYSDSAKEEAETNESLEEASLSSSLAGDLFRGIGIGLEGFGFVEAIAGFRARVGGCEKEAGNMGFGDLISGFGRRGLDLVGAGE